jgi:hypothetical protein
MLHKKLRKKGVDVVFEDFVDWDFHGTPLEEGFMRAMQSCNTAVTAGRAMPITRATTFSTSGLLGRLLLHWLLRWCAGLVRAEIRFLRPSVMRPVRVDPRLRPILRPPHPVVPDPVM